MRITTKYSFQGQEYDAFFPLLQRDLEQHFKKLGLSLQQVIYSVANATLRRIVYSLKARHGKSYPRGTTGSSLSMRSGRGVHGIHYTLRKERDGKSITGTVYSPFTMYTHEESKSGIVPVKSTYLAIPLPYALRSDGSKKKLSPRQWGNTYVRKFGGGAYAIVFLRKGKNSDEDIPLYLYLKSTSRPARYNLEKTAEEEEKWFTATFLNDVQKIINRGRTYGGYYS